MLNPEGHSYSKQICVGSLDWQKENAISYISQLGSTSFYDVFISLLKLLFVFHWPMIFLCLANTLITCISFSCWLICWYRCSLFSKFWSLFGHCCFPKKKVIDHLWTASSSFFKDFSDWITTSVDSTAAYYKIWLLVIFKLKVYSLWWNYYDSSESVGTHRILWGEKFGAVQKAGVSVKDRTKVRADIPETQWWLESMVKQIICI